MKLVFDDRALSDLDGIFDWIAKDNPAAAKAVVERIFVSVEHLAKFPQMAMRGWMRDRSNGSYRGYPISLFMKTTAMRTR